MRCFCSSEPNSLIGSVPSSCTASISAARRARLGDLLDRDVEHQRAGAGAAVLLVERQAEEVVLGEQLADVPRVLGLRVDLRRPRRDPLARPSGGSCRGTRSGPASGRTGCRRARSSWTSRTLPWRWARPGVTDVTRDVRYRLVNALLVAEDGHRGRRRPASQAPPRRSGPHRSARPPDRPDPARSSRIGDHVGSLDALAEGRPGRRGRDLRARRPRLLAPARRRACRATGRARYRGCYPGRDVARRAAVARRPASARWRPSPPPDTRPAHVAAVDTRDRPLVAGDGHSALGGRRDERRAELTLRAAAPPPPGTDGNRARSARELRALDPRPAAPGHGKVVDGARGRRSDAAIERADAWLRRGRAVGARPCPSPSTTVRPASWAGARRSPTRSPAGEQPRPSRRGPAARDHRRRVLRALAVLRGGHADPRCGHDGAATDVASASWPAAARDGARSAAPGAAARASSRAPAGGGRCSRPSSACSSVQRMPLRSSARSCRSAGPPPPCRSARRWRTS